MSFRHSTAAVGTGPFVQTVETLDGREVVARAIWFATELDDGHVQLLHLHVQPAHQRRGVGTALFHEVLRQARALFASRGAKLRRVTAELPHKSHVIGRAWLSKQGFHHVGTLKNVVRKQDVLVYLLGTD